VLLSVGVHGDETGPIEMVAHVVDALSRAPQALAVDLMLCVGNIDAIAAGKRFIDADLNRMFRPTAAPGRHLRGGRADTLIAATVPSSMAPARCAGTSTCTRRSALRTIRCLRSCRT
jgi:succinylglutamate desuccinylase